MKAQVTKIEAYSNKLTYCSDLDVGYRTVGEHAPMTVGTAWADCNVGFSDFRRQCSQGRQPCANYLPLG